MNSNSSHPAGLADRVSVELLDHRSATGEYDAVVSVEEQGAEVAALGFTRQIRLRSDG